MSETYPSFRKIPRLHKEVVITEKLDGTNGLIHIERLTMGSSLLYGEGNIPKDRIVILDESEHDDAGLPTHEFVIRAGSRNRWLAPGQDNHGFAAWVRENAVELTRLGPGHHYGEWFGQGIQRGYGLAEKRFALFNVAKWRTAGEPGTYFRDVPEAPACCTVVPVVCVINGAYMGDAVAANVHNLKRYGSWAVPGYDKPEGLIVYHMAAGVFFKVLIEGDGLPKSLVDQAGRA